jgi:methionyl-tRNA formyltransferase
VRIGWLSFHIVGAKALLNLLNNDCSINSLITLTDKELDRRSGVFDYSDLCLKYNIPIYKVDHINSDQSIDLLRRLDLDIVFVMGWSQIINKQILEIPRLGMVGVHSSLLPHNRGSAPVNWSIINGERETGSTLMLLDEGVDTGDIIDQISFPITLYDSCKTIYDRVADVNVTMIHKLYNNLHNGIFPHLSQEINTLEDILPRRRPKDGLIDWNNASIDIYNFIRAQTRPYPGAFSFINNTKYYILQSASFPELIDNLFFASGEVIGPVYSTVIDACGVLVKCNHSFILILEVEDEMGVTIKGKELNTFFTKGSVFSSENHSH